MKAIWNGAVIAQSDDTVVVEGNHYFPESSLNRDYVTFSNHHTMGASSPTRSARARSSAPSALSGAI